jgi:hypothetical protein
MQNGFVISRNGGEFRSSYQKIARKKKTNKRATPGGLQHRCRCMEIFVLASKFLTTFSEKFSEI